MPKVIFQENALSQERKESQPVTTAALKVTYQENVINLSNSTAVVEVEEAMVCKAEEVAIEVVEENKEVQLRAIIVIKKVIWLEIVINHQLSSNKSICRKDLRIAMVKKILLLTLITIKKNTEDYKLAQVKITSKTQELLIYKEMHLNNKSQTQLTSEL